jgi:16S rRNA (cytosine967-C5)-methyltransferase
MAGEVPRELAVQILTRVLSDQLPLDLAFEVTTSPKSGKSITLDTQSRAWLRDVCSGSLRWKGRLDAVIDSIALKKKPSGSLRKILLVAAYQLILQERVAAAIVVDETVEMIKGREGDAPAKFANALLRKIADSAEAWKTLPFPKKGTPAEQASWASLPEWFWNKILHQRGLEWSEKFAEACFARPELWIHAHTSEGAKLGEAGSVEGSYRLNSSGMISDQEGFSEGLFFVQDISSQFLISEISLAVKAELGKHPTALDLCAAPGGKTLGLSWHGFQVTATDIDSNRLKLVSQNSSRLASQITSSGGAIDVVEREKIAALPEQDLVWVDAPCSGSGIIRRHPDVRWLRQEKELHALKLAQEGLLREAWKKTKPGGFLAYSVCSIFEDEGAGAIKRVGLSQHLQKEWLLSPHHAPHGDGFWAGLLRKPLS